MGLGLLKPIPNPSYCHPFVTYVNDELSQKTLILWGDLKDKLNSNRQSFSFCSFL
ncbi:hypothetical protein HanXRQr2_Chr09g0373011 [Helianthus annuus]|uniref:Uncharacterized protein n=1 Tax=Helianthus annuus TaxID=4232 RepID=A0A9K3I4B8_HELAN|nr:hypothetical protein HanXRQr2_Chr09g0373011 [Helianthus annuus]